MNQLTLNFGLPFGLCACGCGGKTNVVYGRFKEFVHGHNATRERNNRWRGGKMLKRNRPGGIGYNFTFMPSHPKANKIGYVPDHVLIVENILGKYLPLTAEVHHFDENSLNNAPQNFIVCQDSSYHQILHQRAKALKACGHASWRKCQYCHQYDDPANMMVKWKGVRGSRHQDCYNRYQKESRLRRMGGSQHEAVSDGD